MVAGAFPQAAQGLEKALTIESLWQHKAVVCFVEPRIFKIPPSDKPSLG